MIKREERLEYFDPLGNKYPLTVGVDRVVMTESGFGMPPIEYVTQRGVYQHGETAVAYYLRPRTIQLLIRHKYCDRNAYWAGRAALLDILRPNKLLCIVPGTLRKITPNGTKRDIKVLIDQGPEFAPRETTSWNEFGYVEDLRFIAHDPVWYNPTLKTVTLDLSTSTGQLVFPITFPISFGNISSTGVSVAYAGNWQSYPTIYIYGPIDQPVITNVTTGEIIALAAAIPAGDIVTITLAFGAKSIINLAGTDLIATVTASSNFGTFHLEPGNNLFTIAGNSIDPAVTKFVLEYYERYIGI